MNREEFLALSLKARTLKVQLPSGIEIDFILPPTGELVKFYNDITKSENITEDIMNFIQKGLPEEITITDLPYEDFCYLRDLINDFFVNTSKKKLQNGSQNTQEN